MKEPGLLRHAALRALVEYPSMATSASSWSSTALTPIILRPCYAPWFYLALSFLVPGQAHVRPAQGEGCGEEDGAQGREGRRGRIDVALTATSRITRVSNGFKSDVPERHRCVRALVGGR